MNKLQLGNNNSNYPECHDLTFEFWHSDSSLLLCFYLWILNRSFMTHFLKKRLLWTCQNSCSSCFDDDAHQQLYYILVIKTLSLTWKSNAKRILYAHCHHSKTVNFWAQLASLWYSTALKTFFSENIHVKASSTCQILRHFMLKKGKFLHENKGICNLKRLKHALFLLFLYVSL